MLVLKQCMKEMPIVVTNIVTMSFFWFQSHPFTDSSRRIL